MSQSNSPEAPVLPAPPKSGGRILELDAIRALSCLNLLLFHFTWVYQEKYGFASDLGFTFPYGKYGVQLFFMLSGLVNAMTLLSKRKPGDFIVARCIRILPSYWLVIVMNVCLFMLIPMYNHPVHVDETVANLSTMPVLFGFDNMEPVTWTLQIEMLFYAFLMGLFAVGLLEKPLRTMLVSIGVCLVLGVTFTFVKTNFPDSIWNSRCRIIEELFFIRHLPLFAMGILLNELRCGRGNKWALWGGIVAAATVFHIIDLREHNPLATVLMFGLLTASAFRKVPILRWKPLIYISFISYSLYLVHNNLGSAVMKQLETIGCSPLLTVILATAFAIGVSHAMTYWMEQPITNWLRKKYKSHAETFASWGETIKSMFAKQAKS
ncbi:MAG: acyltransferase [Planctomycetota bacterium]